MHGRGSGPSDIHRSGVKELQTVCMAKEYKLTFELRSIVIGSDKARMASKDQRMT